MPQPYFLIYLCLKEVLTSTLLKSTFAATKKDKVYFSYSLAHYNQSSLNVRKIISKRSRDMKNVKAAYTIQKVNDIFKAQNSQYQSYRTDLFQECPTLHSQKTLRRSRWEALFRKSLSQLHIYSSSRQNKKQGICSVMSNNNVSTSTLQYLQMPSSD